MIKITDQDRFKYVEYLEKQEDYKLDATEIVEFESSKEFCHYLKDEIAKFGWSFDTAMKELLCEAFGKWLLFKALNVPITRRHDSLTNRMEKDLEQLGHIAIYGENDDSNMAIDKAMRIKLALMMMRYGAPKGMTIRT